MIRCRCFVDPVSTRCGCPSPGPGEAASLKTSPTERVSADPATAISWIATRLGDDQVFVAPRRARYPAGKPPQGVGRRLEQRNADDGRVIPRSFERQLQPPRAGFLRDTVNTHLPRACAAADSLSVETLEQALARSRQPTVAQRECWIRRDWCDEGQTTNRGISAPSRNQPHGRAHQCK